MILNLKFSLLLIKTTLINVAVYLMIYSIPVNKIV